MTLSDRLMSALRRLFGEPEHEVVMLVETIHGVRQVRVPASRL